VIHNVPHLDQFFGVWSIRPAELQALRAWASNIDLHVHLQGDAAQATRNTAAAGSSVDVRSGVAIVPLAGTLLKHQSSLPGSTSTTLARRKIRQAVDDPEVSSILLHVESGGGTVAGAKELADEIYEARQKKPLWAFIEDIGASAAYYAASQAGRIVANASAAVGSIGTYGVVIDESGRAEKEGVKVHIVKAGAFKATGYPGTKVTTEQLAELQKLIDGHQAFFTAAVARGRKLPMASATTLADGRVHLAAEAKRLGLIDAVDSLEATFQALASGKGKATPAAGAATGPARSVGAVEQFENRARELMANNKSLTWPEACREVRRKDLELYKEYIQQTNKRAGRQLRR
jgi:signal peptide peptidase SppA